MDLINFTDRRVYYVTVVEWRDEDLNPKCWVAAIPKWKGNNIHIFCYYFLIHLPYRHPLHWPETTIWFWSWSLFYLVLLKFWMFFFLAGFTIHASITWFIIIIIFCLGNWHTINQFTVISLKIWFLTSRSSSIWFTFYWSSIICFSLIHISSFDFSLIDLLSFVLSLGVVKVKELHGLIVIEKLLMSKNISFTFRYSWHIFSP